MSTAGGDAAATQGAAAPASGDALDRARPGELRPGEVPVTAIAFDRRIALPEAAARLPWAVQARGPYSVSLRAGEAEELHLFAFGAAAVVGKTATSPELRATLEKACGAPLLPQTEETYFLVAEPGCAPDTLRLGWDRVVVAASTPETVGATALLLGQSAALERYELAVAALLDEAMGLLKLLAEEGRLSWRGGAPVRRIAALVHERLELARWFFLVDRPDVTWDDPLAARLYDQLFAHLELADRHRALAHKLEAIEDALARVIDLWEGRRGRLLEGLIIALIVLEIALALAGIF